MPDWETIIRDEGPAVWQTAYRLVGNRADADECMQETFMAAVVYARRDEIRSWPALLRRLAVSRSIDCLRRRPCWRTQDQSATAFSAALSSSLAPEAVVQNRELSEMLREALAKLPPRQAEVVCLRYLGEMEYEEISRELAISVRHVGVILSRARDKLRKLLKERGAGNG